ncbi:hypothetical protein EYF80_033099 [Liparis tanakae]|uniref:Uncharacterized protein n=1 Tax=Liparis tanakae TaxID=230148 RepID=A0A4Z2GVA4_9TELE|nr:hypothetical protein EYF80_033099 [Liparis tanakae]
MIHRVHGEEQDVHTGLGAEPPTRPDAPSCTTERRPEETGDRRQETGDRGPGTGDRRQETGDRRQL